MPATFWRCPISERVRNLTTEGAESARRFACDAARLARASHCRDVAVLDVRGISPVTDFFVIATGTSGRQMKSVAEEIEELGQPRGFNPFGRNGHEGETWVLTDFVDVVLHVFSPTSRSYYDLDGLWGDATRLDWAAETALI